MFFLSFSCIYDLLLLAWEGEEIVGICQPHCILKKYRQDFKIQSQTERSSSMIEFVFDIQKALCLIQSTTEKKGEGSGSKRENRERRKVLFSASSRKFSSDSQVSRFSKELLLDCDKFSYKFHLKPVCLMVGVLS